MAGGGPRIRGDHMPNLLAESAAAGSSPPTRGPPRAQRRVLLEGGVIPAYAGTTPGPRLCRAPAGDHPRMCGDHNQGRLGTHVVRGSSPHVRGPRVLVVACLHVVGIIPACAGTTSGCRTSLRRPGDHPRMCGDHQKLLDLMRTFQGSSPHARGPRHVRAARHGLQGIIPACAGTTTRWCRPCSPTRDHPRMCGDHEESKVYTTEYTGSSPHAWGPPLKRRI